MNTGDVVVDIYEKRVRFKIYSRFIYIVMSMHNLYVNIHMMMLKVFIPVMLLWTI